MDRNLSLSLLRGDLTAAGFTVERLDELWGEDAAAALHRGHRVPALQAIARLSDPPAVATLAELFVLGLPVSAAALAEALPSLGLGNLVDLALVTRRDDGTVAPLVDLRPYAFTDAWGSVTWWIASDLGELALGRALDENHVLGVGGASLTLSGLMVDRAARSVLDLGTGCGIQAMHASRHSGRVVATDISQRALDFARFNAELNGITGIEFRLGSLYEPVAGERFDHIVSNPPFVITPRGERVPEYEYRDGGLVGDAIVAKVIEGAADHLEPGGIAQLLGNWEYRETEDGLDRVRGWIDRARLDGWVIERELQDPALYAETWIRDGGTRSGERFDQLSGAWLDDFAARGVTRVGFGYVTLRNPATGLPRFSRFERIETALRGALGQQVLATLDAYDWQASLDDAAFVRTMLTVAPDVTEERHYWPGDEHPAAMTLRQGGGFARTYPLDTALAAVVGTCDGELSIAAICSALAELLGTPDAPIDADELQSQLVPTLRELVTVGILTR